MSAYPDGSSCIDFVRVRNIVQALKAAYRSAEFGCDPGEGVSLANGIILKAGLGARRNLQLLAGIDPIRVRNAV